MNADATSVRPYRAEDRAAVRFICCQTADRGNPLGPLYTDGEFVADAIIAYFTDYERRFFWVVESDPPEVVGYLAAAVDTRRQQRVTTWRILPWAVARAIGRGALRRAETWRMVAALGRNLRQHAHKRDAALRGYPAHIHINLLPAFRGRHLGRRLLDAALVALAGERVAGVHATVRADNAPACGFFAQMGFRPIGKYDITVPARGGVQDVEVTVYGKRIFTGPTGSA